MAHQPVLTWQDDAKAAPGGINVFFDNVGGWQMAAAFQNMKIHGRVSMCGAISNFGTTPQPSTAVMIEMILRRITVQGTAWRFNRYAERATEKGQSADVSATPTAPLSASAPSTPGTPTAPPGACCSTT